MAIYVLTGVCVLLLAAVAVLWFQKESVKDALKFKSETVVTLLGNIDSLRTDRDASRLEYDLLRKSLIEKSNEFEQLEEEQEDEQSEQLPKFMMIGSKIFNTRTIERVDLKHKKEEGSDATEISIFHANGQCRDFSFESQKKQEVLIENVIKALDVHSVNLTEEQVDEALKDEEGTS